MQSRAMREYAARRWTIALLIREFSPQSITRKQRRKGRKKHPRGVHRKLLDILQRYEIGNGSRTFREYAPNDLTQFLRTTVLPLVGTPLSK